MDHIHFTGPTHLKFLVKNIVNKRCLICAEMCFQLFYILCFTFSWDSSLKVLRPGPLSLIFPLKWRRWIVLNLGRIVLPILYFVPLLFSRYWKSYVLHNIDRKQYIKCVGIRISESEIVQYDHIAHFALSKLKRKVFQWMYKYCKMLKIWTVRCDHRLVV